MGKQRSISHYLMGHAGSSEVTYYPGILPRTRIYLNLLLLPQQLCTSGRSSSAAPRPMNSGRRFLNDVTAPATGPMERESRENTNQ